MPLELTTFDLVSHWSATPSAYLLGGGEKSEKFTIHGTRSTDRHLLSSTISLTTDSVFSPVLCYRWGGEFKPLNSVEAFARTRRGHWPVINKPLSSRN